MNWFVSELVSADSVLQAGLPFLEVICALVGIIAVLMLLIALGWAISNSAIAYAQTESTSAPTSPTGC